MNSDKSLSYQDQQYNLSEVVFKSTYSMLSKIREKIFDFKGGTECIFCQIRDQTQTPQINHNLFLYEDDFFFAIHDIKKASAKQHILVLTKEHVRSALEINNLQTFKRMKAIALKVLCDLENQSNLNLVKVPNEKDLQSDERKNQDKFRLGFHIPPYNSIDHIHLHGLTLPIENLYYDKFVYGWMLTPVDNFLKQSQKKQSNT